MCGIAGFFDKQPNYDAKKIASLMGEAIYHRGPNSEGVWQDLNLGVNLIHRRLAILDLSIAGHQPMQSANNRFIIVFNGEIYNFKSLMHQLEAKIGEIIWRGHSDTEVILKAIEIYGFIPTLTKLEGMFAIALWDRAEHKLFLARDRIGEKPLYYGYFNGIFAFASELTALRKHPKFNFDINHNAVGQLLLHACIPAPLSIFNGIEKLTPGHFLCINYDDIVNTRSIISQPYWELKNFNQVLYTGNQIEVINDLELLLKNIIKDQMIADVPVGCFLSGGVDSSLVATLMQQQSAQTIHTFSIGFNNPKYNEAHFAKKIANHIGSNHQELYVTEKDALTEIPKLATIYDEPFADSSQLPTYFLSKFAKQKITVALSGDAGDELFAGYNRYILSPKIYNTLQKYPLKLRLMLSKLIPLITSNFLSHLNKFFKLPITNFNDKLYKLESLLKVQNHSDFYTTLTGHWLNYYEVVPKCNLKQSLWLKTIPDSNSEILKQMQYWDMLGYLPDDILVKVDRAAMATSLETRIPFLNHRMIEFAFSLPNNYKIRNGVSKWCLRKILYKYVPQELIERPKQGFAIPINEWLRNKLKDWMIETLNPVKLSTQGYFNPQLVKIKLDNHLSAKENNGYYLWNILMFQQWLDYSNNMM